MLGNPTPEQLPTISSNEFLPRINPWAITGGGFIVVILGGGVILASVLEYNVAVKAPGAIRPAGELRLVEAAFEGTVEQIAVEENQVVKRGDTIVRIDDSRLQTQKSQLQSRIRQIQLQLSKFYTQIEELQAQVEAQTRLINRNIVAAQAELRGVERNYQDQTTKVQADLAEAQASLELARVQLERLQQEKVLTATVEEAQAALQVARVQRDRLLQVLQSGAISRNLFEEREQAVKSAQAKLEQAKASTANLLEEKQQDLRLAQLKLTRYKTAINPSDAPIVIATERIKQERAKGEATLAALNKELQVLLQQQLELQTQLKHSQKELQQLEHDLTRSLVRAPISGTVLKLNLRNSEQVVQPGEAIAYIAPVNAPLLIKAQVPIPDIDKVKTGQKVQMQVSACPYPDYGTLNGVVKTIAPDILPVASNQANSPSLPIYEVSIEPQTLVMENGSSRCQLQPGMNGNASIISRKETIMKFIFRKARFISNI
ncbi:HlyD family efflux transporter periplasmic adaptor subunit [Gloeocapsopsis crepidinum LEGE 06123]|uniref:HlyD family efflux transporter periplasmic adaptor subunit n=1 Tax=Gloeocapsopsis crepidinum LEGE 06123 TaxID=588587 RepID=A0ABR9UVT3_9CHRO|nr:HlyD family efflux transporter periplasmic adaptor subunit [Gloeocapsopsis crepidinum]MBE9192394.1 HlyD family efflux transporter periplasmic adaptor subunit [Gloeocapsopsis crepidinum LEGE 06123]